MSAKRILNLIIRNIVILFLCVLGGLYLAVDQTSKTVPIFSGKATIFVATPAGIDAGVGQSKIGDLTTGNSFSQARVKSYAGIVSNPITLGKLISDNRLKYSVQDLMGKISAKEIPGTVLIEITALDANPERAAELANWVSFAFADTVASLEQDVSTGDNNLIKIKLIKAATVNKQPVSPRKLFNYFIGIFIGSLLGVIYLFIRNLTDQKVKNESDLSDTQLLGLVPYDREAKLDPLIVSQDKFSTRTESYRSLRSSVIHQLEGGPGKSVVFTSCKPSEGKTTGVLNMGFSLAKAGKKVIVVETDMRRPTFKNYGAFLGFDPKYPGSKEGGLAQLLDARTGNLTSKRIKAAIFSTNVENLALLPCASLPENPAELLEGGRIGYLGQWLEKEYDVVLFDTPPALSVVDSIALSRIIKNVYLVIHAGKTSKRDFQTAKESFRDLDIELAGVILNMVPKHRLGSDYGYSRSGYSYYRYSYAYESDTKPENNLKGNIFKKVSSSLSKRKNGKPILRENLPKFSLSKRTKQPIPIPIPAPKDKTKFIEEEHSTFVEDELMKIRSKQKKQKASS